MNTNVFDSEFKVEDLYKVFERLKEYVTNVRDINETMKGRNFKQNDNGNFMMQFHNANTGAKLKVKWCSADVNGTGWKPGWYIGYVQTSDPSQDQIVVEHPLN